MIAARAKAECWESYEAQGIEQSELKICDLQSENGDCRKCQTRNLTSKLRDCVTRPELQEVLVMPKIPLERHQYASLLKK